MKMSLDDDLNRIEGRFVGTPPPMRITLPFHFRYKSYLVFSVLFLIYWQILALLFDKLNFFVRDALVASFTTISSVLIMRNVTNFMSINTQMLALFTELLGKKKRETAWTEILLQQYNLQRRLLYGLVQIGKFAS